MGWKESIKKTAVVGGGGRLGVGGADWREWQRLKTSIISGASSKWNYLAALSPLLTDVQPWAVGGGELSAVLIQTAADMQKHDVQVGH